MGLHLNASASVATGLHNGGIDRFIKSKAIRFVEAALDAARDELSNRTDLDVKISNPQVTSTKVTGELRVKSSSQNILSEELGTESSSPAHTVGQLVKDPSVRSRIVRKAAQSLK